MLTASDILFGVLLPLVLSGLILAVSTRLKSQSHGASHGASHWAGPLAIGVAFAAGFGLVEGRAHLFPPADAVAKLFYLGVLFTLVGLLDACVRLPAWLRPILVFLATLLGTRFLLAFNFNNHSWDASHGFAWLGGIAVVATIWWACFESVALEKGLAMPLGAMLTSGIGGLVVMLVADQTTGQALGALGIAIAAAAPVVGWFKGPPLARGTAIVIAGVGVSAIAVAYFVSDVPIIDLTLVCIAPLVLLVSRWLPIKKPWLRITVRLFIVLIPLGIALALAVAQFRREQAEKSSDPYSLAPTPSAFPFV